MSKIEVICYHDKNFHFGQKYKVTREEKILMAIQEVIKYEGENSVLIYKHPAEDFNTMSQQEFSVKSKTDTITRPLICLSH